MRLLLRGACSCCRCPCDTGATAHICNGPCGWSRIDACSTRAARLQGLLLLLLLWLWLWLLRRLCILLRAQLHRRVAVHLELQRTKSQITGTM